ncbi:glycosyltransferase [Polaribacter sp. MSW13]|uniref:Glycosyltransferase n=1 Tax=Polaribacter marinus TaxID=2916838 RepID=A0A9X2AJ16_9FLAO|nr:glycosyltransferase [Polaribacter marinus]MCI2228627.1 glycosyltransferase [Polaribacter marinus]
MDKKIIVAPLNWGLGHTARCVPIIHFLIENNYTPVIASDGNALVFLQKEFPNLKHLLLPSYHIKYGSNLKFSLFLQSPKIWKAIRKEQKIIEEFIDENSNVVGVISDNRFGVRSGKVPSVYITHQVNVFSGFTSLLTSKIHQKIIIKFDECWIPDNDKSEFSGKLSSTKNSLNLKFIGVLSRFKKENLEETIDVLILLSGPEPNRTLLESKLKKEFLNSDNKIVLVQGKVEEKQRKTKENKITIYNFLLSNELQKRIHQSKMVVCRSGYSSIIDLAVLHKKVFFIPTKNQSEQEYLATYFQQKKVAPFCAEEDFTLKKLLEIEKYKGLSSEETQLNTSLLGLFKCKRKL